VGPLFRVLRRAAVTLAVSEGPSGRSEMAEPTACVAAAGWGRRAVHCEAVSVAAATICEYDEQPEELHAASWNWYVVPGERPALV
jgi:hypothetical protein